MKFYIYLFSLLAIVSSCKEETEDTPILANNYGSGYYFATDNGVSYLDSSLTSFVPKNQIFREVNGSSISNVNRIKFQGTKAYIATENSFYSVNIETFGLKGEVTGFKNLVDFDFVALGRIFAVDKEDSKVKEVDLDRMEVASVIETGDSTKPVFIVSKWYRSIVMNGGSEPDSLNDSTIVAIDYKDDLVPLADLMGSLYVGDNPNSAVNIYNLKILCKGIYDPNDLTTKTQSTLVTVNPWDLLIVANTTLNGVYNAQNLVSNDDGTKYYFTAENGIYQMNTNGSSVSLIDPIVSDILYFLDEEYFVFTTDTTPPNVLNRNVLFVNDTQNDPSIVYKYNLDLNAFTDTLIFDGNVRDVNFYQ
jgi:hypothetical protein